MTWILQFDVQVSLYAVYVQKIEFPVQNTGKPYKLTGMLWYGHGFTSASDGLFGFIVHKN